MRCFPVGGTLLLLAFCLSCSDNAVGTGPEFRQVELVVLAPLSGAESLSGGDIPSAVEYAAAEINRQLSELLEFTSISFFDTEAEPDSALQQLMRAGKRGGSFVIGPFTDAALARCKSYADANDLLLLSPTSTARSLSIAGDNLYRLLPDDAVEIEALVTLLEADTVESLIAVFVDDPWMSERENLLRQRFQQGGGIVSASFPFDPATANVTALGAAIEAAAVQANSLNPGRKLAICLLSPDQAAALMEFAAGTSVMAGLPWYASSDLAQNAALAQDAETAAFAEQVGLLCPSFRPQSATAENLADSLRARSGKEPGLKAFSSYSAVVLLALAHTAEEQNDIGGKRRALEKAFLNLSIIPNNLNINDAGDLRGGIYDYWAIRRAGAAFEWRPVANFDSETQVIERIE